MSTETRTLTVADPSSSEPRLIPVLGARWALGLKHLVVTAAFAGLFVFLNHLPLRGTDLWGHVVWGKHILAERSLPTTDPLLPTADGMRIVDLMWLSQVVLAAVESLGPEALVGLFTIVVWSTYVLLARACYLQTRQALLSTAVVGLTLNVGWNRVTTIRPENFAMLLFAALLWLLIGHRERREQSILADDRRGEWKLWLGIPLIFAAWANLHGSFPCGVAVLGCYWLGRVLETAWHERSLREVLLDREVRRRLYWLESAVAATLVNPYTIDAWIEAVRFSSNPNLRDVLEWQPLVVLGVGGREFTAACIVLAVVLRHSRRPIAPADVLLLGSFGLLAAMQVRMTGWFAAVWGVVVAPQLADVLSRWSARGDVDPASAAAASSDADSDDADLPTEGRSFRYTLACACLIWIAFAFSTFSRPVLGGKPRGPETLYESMTPLKVTAWLNDHAPVGQVFNPQYWGDWLGWAGPKSMRLFATTNVHLMPRSAWADYLRISNGDVGWDATMERYRVRTAIVDKNSQPTLLRALRASADWAQTYEDDQAVVFDRRPAAAKSAPVAPSAGASHAAPAAPPSPPKPSGTAP